MAHRTGKLLDKKGNIMDCFWSTSADKLKTELDALGMDLPASIDEISAKAGDWFAAMSDKEKLSIFATMCEKYPDE